MARRANHTDSTGTVLNIQRFSVHDGPGIRTVVFLKGCSLRCLWCSNPESLSRRRQLGIYPKRCIGLEACGACLEAAPSTDSFVVEDNRVTGLRDGHSGDLFACARVCPTGALKNWGETMTVEQVMQEVLADREFYEESGGGLTLSGGEAMVQNRFAIDLLRAARSEGLHTCVETALNYPSKVLDAALPHIDMALCDIKHMDLEQHRQYTGAGNTRILDNLRRVAASGTPIVVRIPVVPGINGTEKNLRATAEFIVSQLGDAVLQVQLLPFRRLGVEKYASLGLSYPMDGLGTSDFDKRNLELSHFAEMMSAYGLNAVPGTGHRIPTEPLSASRKEAIAMQ